MRRHAHAATCISGPLLVIVGGWVTGEMTCDCWIYDFTTMHWKQVSMLYYKYLVIGCQGHNVTFRNWFKVQNV